MPQTWSLGGLSVIELLKRTARESWEDEVFGQAARLAFYHFLAIFPVLLLVLMALTRLAGAGADMRTALTGSFRQFLPADAASLVAGAINDLTGSARAAAASLFFGALSAVWASFNAAWAMIVGLNIAYEVDEDRDWRRIALISSGLALTVVALIFAALVAMHVLGGSRNGMAAGLLRWAAVTGILLISFGLFYRFGPNLKNQAWQWSTPGAVFAALLWVGATFGYREYCDHFGHYQQIYGRAAAMAALLLWMYMTSAAVLIGAELNSEIEKASDHVEGPDGRRRKA
ncbi:MAG TPA: YihY/virulence factor BrkB family protein [Bryobacteraceae bacterium]|nr:YihY/virulence factor BrkB family protein [Bryobacteraceae bacterium]